jgi:hypothetical protein
MSLTTDDDRRDSALQLLEMLAQHIEDGNVHGLVLGAENVFGAMEFFTTYEPRDTVAMAALVNHWAINRVFPAVAPRPGVDLSMAAPENMQ